jgi:hypothetical protein
MTCLSLVLILVSCVTESYLPEVNKIDVNNFGSRINVKRISGPMIKGELIAIDSSQMFVLIDTGKTDEITRYIEIIPVKEIESFRVIYAKPVISWVTIPVFTASTASHGFYFVISAPINLLVTSLASSGAMAFEYNNQQISYEDLKMFARFPQGIPSGIDISQIK